VNQIAVTSVLRALWLVALGMTFWAIGYFVGPSHLLRRLASRGVAALADRRTYTVRNQFTPWLIYAVGVIARILATATTGRFGYVGNPVPALSTATGYNQVLTELSFLCPIAVCAAALQVYRERVPGARITLTVLSVAELAFGAAAGGKQSFVVVVLAVVVPMSAARRRLPRAAVVAGILIFLVVVIPFNKAYRIAVRGGSAPLSTSQAIDDAPAILRQALTNQSLISTLANSTTYLLQRDQEIEGPAIILQRTPGQIAFNSPIQLIEAPLVDMVPRAIWPGKPIFSPGYQFSQQYYGIPATIITASAISPIGDLYRHGGWIPVIAGMLFFGAAVRLLDDALDVRSNPHAIFFTLLLFPDLVKGEDDWVTFMAGIPAILVIWLIAVSLTFRAKRPS